MHVIEKDKIVEMTCKELRAIGKEFHIKGYWNMKKSDLLESISACIEEREHNKKAEEKKQRIERAEAGLLVAFNNPKQKGRIMTAKILQNNRESLVVETKFGLRLEVESKDVIWVKTGSRWPKQIYLELIKDRGARNEEKHCNR